MNAYRVIRHPGDEDEGARWACRARQQRGPVEIASGLPNGRVSADGSPGQTDDGRVVRDFKLEPTAKWSSGVLDVHQLCALQVSQLHEYFYNKRHVPLYNKICRRLWLYTTTSS